MTYSATEHSRAIAALKAANDYHDRLKWLADVSENPTTAKAWSDAADAFDAFMHDELRPVLQAIEDLEADASTGEWLRYEMQKVRAQ